MTSVRHESTRVPVEHRLLGIDRRSIPYAAVAFAVIALWAWVMPWVDDQVPWDDTLQAGDVVQVTDDVTMNAAPGWGIVKGLLASDRTRSGQKSSDQVVLVKDGVVFSILQGPFEGTPSRLLRQVKRITGVGGEGFSVATTPQDVVTASGLRGVAQDFSSARNVGTIYAFVVDGVGIDIQVVGPEAQMQELSNETAAMIGSLATTGGSR